MTEENKPVPTTVSLEHGIEPLQQSNHHLLTAGAEGLPVRMHLSHLSYPESFCVLLPPSPAASQKQHSAFTQVTSQRKMIGLLVQAKSDC